MNAQKRIREAYAMMTAAEHRAQAADCRDRVADSWERSDTDGFLSQWAWGLTENLHIRQAEILEAGGRSEFSGLYQGDRRVAAKQIETQYGECWLLRDDEAAQFGRKFIPFVGCGGGSSRVQKRLPGERRGAAHHPRAQPSKSRPVASGGHPDAIIARPGALRTPRGTGQETNMQNETTKDYTYYGLPVVERDGIEYAVAENDAAADAAARGYILDSLWAFRATFLQNYIPALRNDRARAAFVKMQGEMCEGANDLVLAMLGNKLNEMVRDAIAADGRGHFLSPYDGHEVEEGVRFLYRIN